MRFFQVDVFTDRPYSGNPLAVFPEAKGLTAAQMQAIAREMNLSETTFVTTSDSDSYTVRIFTPQAEIPFAGHPTIGTAAVMRHVGGASGRVVVQRSAAGETPITVEGSELWFERTGKASPDLEQSDTSAARRVAKAVGIEERDLGLEARELGRAGLLRPANADAGVEQLMVPVRDVDALGRCVPNNELLAKLSDVGAYCFTATQAGRVRARGFMSLVGVPEDPATGSAAAGLGVYLAARVGEIRFEVAQGIEMGRESKIHVHAAAGKVAIGGRCALVLEGTLAVLPEA